MSKTERIRTDGGENMGQNPFTGLPSFAKASEDKSSAGLPVASVKPEHDPAKNASGTVGKGGQAKMARKDRGRVDIVREKSGRGGKTVTVVKNFVGIGQPEKEQLAKAMQRACGCGGTVKDGQIEIQGDKREDVARILEAAGFRAVFAGG